MKLLVRKVSHMYLTFSKRCAMQCGTHPANHKEHDINLLVRHYCWEFSKCSL